MNKTTEMKLTQALSANHGASAAADAMKPQVSIHLTEAQRDEILKHVESTGTFPSIIEMNFKGNITKSTLFPVTMLVGAMA